MKTLHCFSMDVEGFCEGYAESASIPPEMIRSVKEKEEIEKNIDVTLKFLDDNKVKGTFFILGIIGAEQPKVVRAIAEAGHEICSHSHTHRRLFNLSKSEIKNELDFSKKSLEDASGVKVLGFRAPEFSIIESNKFVLDMILEAGYVYDSSISPTDGHDVYGISGARRDIYKFENGLVEFPPCTYEILGKIIQVLGGGYIRLLPFWLNKFIMKHFDTNRIPVMTYIHPFEIGENYPIFDQFSFLRRFRRYHNVSKVKDRFRTLFKSYQFGQARDVLEQKGYISVLNF